MAKAIDLSTAGMHVGYAFETTAGTKPKVFTDLPKPKSLPDFNPEPSTYDSTSLNETEYKTYIAGLKDPGGAIGITFGMSQVLLDKWHEIYETYLTNSADNKRLWMEFWHPKLDKAFFFTAEPSDIGMAAADVDSVWDVTVNVTPTGEIGWAEAIKPIEDTSPAPTNLSL